MVSITIAYLNLNTSRALECKIETTCLDRTFGLNQIDSSLHYSYKGRPLSGICLSTVTFQSIGAMPIEVKDYNNEPINIIVKNGSNIEYLAISDTIPNNIRLIVKHDSLRINIAPTLLNKNDLFSIKIITSGNTPTFDVISRITGISKIEVVSKLKNPPPNELMKWILCFHSFVIFLFLYTVPTKGYIGRPVAESVVLIPRRRYTIYLVGLLWISALITMVLPFIDGEWFFYNIISAGIAGCIGVLFFTFNASRWVVYQEQVGENRKKLAASDLGIFD